MERYLQPILGTDKKNPVFSVWQNPETDQYHVYYGMELFEVVPSDHEDMRFKLMIAHLYNAGVKIGALHEAFKVDPKTMKKWGNALKSGDAQKLTDALAGPNARRKLTRAVREYIRIRFASIYREDRYRYSSKIRAELKRVLDVEISAETLRPYLGELKRQFHDDESSPGEESPRDPKQSHAEPPPDEDEDDGEPCENKPRSSEQNEEQESGTDRGQSAKERENAPNNRKEDPQNEVPPQWCSHLGLVLFSQWLIGIEQALGSGGGGPQVRQWLGQILLGALNLEQSKLVSRKDLAILLGPGLMGGPDNQRQRLKELSADPTRAEAILRYNFRQIGGEQMSDFYFDPHSKHYTGKQNVLKGWCPAIRWADKVMHSDVSHSADGQPVYLETTDNYEDLRQRFIEYEKRFRQTLEISQEVELTWTIDRGIYSQEMLQWFAQSPNAHIITWEKDYQRGQRKWCQEQAKGKMILERARNHREDLRVYEFEWIEEPWPKNHQLRRLIVQASNPEGKKIEVSVLSSDRERKAEEILRLIFNRWLQENDFKYLNEHYGIDEITSYQTQDYEELAEQLEDRQVSSVTYRALCEERREEKKRLGVLLVNQRNWQSQQAKRRGKIQDMEGSSQRLEEARRKELGRIKAAVKNADRYAKQREIKINASHQQLERLEKKLEKTQREVSRLQSLISGRAVRMRGERKRLMDAIKLTARNAFYQIFASFKQAYNNYRDDHVWFRHLTSSGGVILKQAHRVICYLISPADYPKRVRQVMEHYLEELTAKARPLPDHSAIPIQVFLGTKSGIKFALADLPNRAQK